MEPRNPSPDSADPPGLSGAELRRRAGAGIAAVGLRQLAIRLVGLGGTVVLARLLLPSDLGAVAVGAALVTVFSFAGDAGISAGLIRGSHTPDRADLQSFLGLQLVVTVLLGVATAVVAWQAGLIGRVTILMVASLPLAALRTPGLILFERELRFGPLVIIELVETVVFYIWAIATVLLGWGVWGLASASPVRALVGSAIMTLSSPAGLMIPRFSWRRLRGLLRFGIQYQAVNAIALARDQGVNLGTAAISGVAVLGLWSLTYRIMQVPFLVFEALWRVSFPAMARLIAAGEDARPIMERGLAMAGVVTGGLLATLVGATPALVPAVFGPRWDPVIGAIPWAALGLMFGGPVSVTTGGYLYAVGDAGSVLLSGFIQMLAWFLVAFALLPVLGVPAVGMGWFAASMVEAVVLSVRTRRHIRLAVFQPLALPAAGAGVAALAGWMTSTYLGPTVISMVSGGATATLLYGAAMLLLRRAVVDDVVRLGRRSLVALAG